MVECCVYSFGILFKGGLIFSNNRFYYMVDLLFKEYFCRDFWVSIIINLSDFLEYFY